MLTQSIISVTNAAAHAKFQITTAIVLVAVAPGGILIHMGIMGVPVEVVTALAVGSYVYCSG